jgi:hypothetical protein
VSDREAKEAREVEQGYQESSLREVRLREWWSSRGDPRKDKAFASMVNSLNHRRWFQRQRAANSELYERAKERVRRRNARVNAERRTARREAVKAQPAVVACGTCGVEWCHVPGVKAGHPRRFCSLACKQRAAGRSWRARRGARDVILCSACGVQFCKVPWATGGTPKRCSEACRRAADAAAKRERRRRR